MIRKLGGGKERRDMRKYSFANMAIHLCNQLPANTVGTVSRKTWKFKGSVR
jgi:hypothetical protein